MPTEPLPPHDNPTWPKDFSPTEIAALRNGWRLIKRQFIYHSKRIFMEFFQEHYLLLEKFRDQTGKINLTRLHEHPQQLLNLYGSLIENGLDDMANFNILMAYISQQHKFHGVTYEDIKLHTDHISLYILQYLEKIISPTYVTALGKLSDLITLHHCEEAVAIRGFEAGSTA